MSYTSKLGFNALGSDFLLGAIIRTSTTKPCLRSSYSTKPILKVSKGDEC